MSSDNPHAPMDWQRELVGEIERQHAAEIERLRAAAEQDAKMIGELQFALHELELCEVDEAAEKIIRRALEGK
jgi:hypothetical protein